MWPRIVEILIGAWLVASPWIFGHAASSGMLMSDLVCGGAVMLLAGLAFLPRFRWAYLFELLVAAWLVGFAFFAAEAPLPGLQNNLLVAMVLALFVVVPSQATKPPRSWRTA